jgi:hypothetical protein
MMKRSSAIFLQVVIVLIAIGTIVLMLWEPQIEGRNVNATLYEIYFKDPFLAYAYLASIPFFVALFHAFKVIGLAGRNKAFSQTAVKSLRTIKVCAILLASLIAATEVYLFIAIRGKDDIAGGLAICHFLILVFVVSAAVAAVLQKLLQNAVDIKSENELTV